MLRSGLVAASIASRSSQLSRLLLRPCRILLFSYSKKKMAGEGTPQGFSRTRASPRPRPSVSAGKSSLYQDDGIHKSSNDACSAKSPQIATQHTRKTSPRSVGSETIRCPQSDDGVHHFDICKIKVGGPVTLKKSLLEINRAKRKEAERANNVPEHLYLRPGMILLKNYIGHNDQVKIIKKCRELGVGLGGFYRPGYRDGAKLQLHMMCLGMNWDPQSKSYSIKRPVDGEEPPKIPADFINLVNAAIQSSHDFLNIKGVNAVAEVPTMSPDICIVNFYENNGRLGLHQDRDEREESLRKGLPVVSFSLGDTANFLYGDERDVDKAKDVELESGDVLIFGGNSRLIFHGVSSITPNTAPKWLIEDTGMLPGRLNLTFRQY